MTELYLLTFQELLIKNVNYKGKLTLLGNIEQNWLQICFTFENMESVIPVIVCITDGIENFEYLCTPIAGDRTCVSKVFEPGFLMSQSFNIVDVKPLVTVELK